MKHLLLFYIAFLFFTPANSQAELAEEVFYRIEKLRQQADDVKSAVEGAKAYIEANKKSLALTVAEKLKLDEIYVDNLLEKLSAYVNNIKIPVSNITIGTQLQTNNLLGLRQTNTRFIDHYYEMQEIHYFLTQNYNQLKLVYKQIGHLHDLLSRLSDSFLELSTKLTGTPGSIVLLDKSAKCKAYATKCNEIKESYSRKLTWLDAEQAKFGEWAKQRLSTYQNLLNNELNWQNQELAAYDELSRKIKAKEAEIDNQNQTLYSLNNRWQQTGNAVQTQKNFIEASRNTIYHNEQQINALKADIAELEKYKANIANLKCPDQRTYNACQVHTEFINNIKAQLAYKDRQIGEKRGQINSLNRSIARENRNISNAQAEIQRLNKEIEKIHHERSNVTRIIQAVRAELEALRREQGAHPEWDYLHVLREECTRDRRILQTRKLFS